MDRQEQILNLAKIARVSVAYAEDLYDSFFEKPVVPQFVADWYEKNKDSFNFYLVEAINNIPYGADEEDFSDFEKWIDDENDSLTILVNMHQFGYEVEKETKYTVRIKVTNQYLCNDEGNLHFSPGFRMDFTKNDLEKLNLGWVFDCPGVEVKEVADE